MIRLFSTEFAFKPTVGLFSSPKGEKDIWNIAGKPVMFIPDQERTLSPARLYPDGFPRRTESQPQLGRLANTHTWSMH